MWMTAMAAALVESCCMWPWATLRELQPCSGNMSGCLPCLQTNLPPSWMMFPWPLEILAWVCSEQPSSIVLFPFLVALDWVLSPILGLPGNSGSLTWCSVLSRIYLGSTLLNFPIFRYLGSDAISPWGSRASFKFRLVPQPFPKRKVQAPVSCIS